MRSRRAFLLVVVLFLSLILFVAGMGYLSSRASLHRSALRAVLATQALEAAEAGVEDVRVKMLKDLDFPPPSTEDQTRFAYTETLTDSLGVARARYTVEVDLSKRDPPYQVYPVTCIGSALDGNDGLVPVRLGSRATSRRRLLPQ